MNEKEYISGLRFVANVLSKNFEQLPVYDLEPKDTPIERKIYPDQTETPIQTRVVQMGFSQQGIKRTCGHAQKSTRVEHAEKK